ncbi:DUF1822 family protein [Plectonema radiosum]|nr:DUF1822 family protein [Plectonema radiosum]
MIGNNQMLKLEDLLEIYPEHLWLEFSEKEQETAWNQSSVNHDQNATACHRAFVNNLCLNTFVKWLEDEPDLPEKFQIPAPSPDLHRQWEFVNGIELTFNRTRLVLIPTEQDNIDEFRIPQEWIDIPNWVANYYVPVQVNLAENWLRIWGFISYGQVIKKAKYDSLDRSYCVDNWDLTADINVMWVAQQLCAVKELKVKPLPSLSKVQAQEIIHQLSKSTVYSPRLDIDFNLWGAILNDNEYRFILYSQSIKKSHNNLMKNTNKIVYNLSSWFDNIFNEGWCSVDDLFSLTDTRAFQFRSDSVLNEVCVKGAKLIDLGMQIENKSVALLIGLSPQIDNKVGIRVQLYPASGETYLPAHIKLSLLSELGTTLHSVESRSYDNYIQLKRFKLPLGKHFSIQVALKDVQIIENFILEGFASSDI